MKRLLLLNMLLLISQLATAQGWGQTQKIVPDDRFVGQQFGATVAIDGNYAVVGVLVSGNARDAYVYKNDGNGNWVQIQKLESPDPHQFAHFGTAVDIDGDYIFIGSWGQHYDANGTSYLQSAGAAYIFEKQASGLFQFHQKIVASDREALNAFGYGLAVDGDYAIVSPVRHDFDASGANFLDDAGAAYIFERDVNGIWSEVQKIVASDRAAFDYFGQSALAVSGNYIAIGSFGEDEDQNGNNTVPSAGSAYIFERDGNGVWSEMQKVVALDRSQGDFFGWSIAIDNNNLVVGSNQDDNFKGAAYVFERNGNGMWNQVDKLTASNCIGGDQFGYDLGIEGSNIVVGARYRDIGSPGDDGAAYVFENQGGTWTETAYIYDAFNKTSEYFGYSVAISGDYALIGAYRDDEDENESNSVQDAGAVFIFDVNEPNTLTITENDFNEMVKAYPNPTKNILNLNFKNYLDEIEVTIQNILGQQVLSGSYRNAKNIQLDFQELSLGMYLVKITIKNNLTSVLKVVKD